MSSFHQATTTRLASLAAVSSSEDSARSMACTAGQGWLHCNSVNVEHAETIGRLLQSGQAGTLLLGHSMRMSGWVWKGYGIRFRVTQDPAKMSTPTGKGRTLSSEGHFTEERLAQAIDRCIRAKQSPGAVTCLYSGLLLRSCSFALVYAAEMQVAGKPSLPLSFPFTFPFFGLDALKYPAETQFMLSELCSAISCQIRPVLCSGFLLIIGSCCATAKGTS